jgi:limonene-1,2-epoxide hydrolase
MEPPAVILDLVDALSSPDGDRAASLVTEDAAIQIPGPQEVPAGAAGARAFAAKQAESDGRKPNVELLDAERQADGRWVASLRFSVVEVASGELQYELTVGGIFTLDGDRVSALQAFPSYEEAVAAASG